MKDSVPDSADVDDFDTEKNNSISKVTETEDEETSISPVRKGKCNVKKRVKTARKHVCSTCKELFSSLSNLYRHIRRRHSDNIDTKLYKNGSAKSTNTELKCSVCETTFLRKLSVAKHKKRCNGVQLAKRCDICNTKFSSVYSRLRHVRRKHNQGSEQADMKLDKPKSESMHMKRQCDICNTEFSSMYNLLRHVRRKHSQDSEQSNVKELSPKSDSTHMKRQCDICNTEFSSVYNRLRHVRRKHSKESEESNMKEHTPKSNSKHIKRQYDGIQSTKHCDICNTEFSSVYNRLRHVRRKHNKESEQSNIRKGKQKSYSRHTKKQFDGTQSTKHCDICNTDFSSVYNRLRHVRRKHNQESELSDTKEVKSKSNSRHFMRPCDICKLEFGSVYNLNRHIARRHFHRSRKHTLTYKCKNCSKAFSTKFAFIKHSKICHKLQEGRARNVCGAKYSNSYEMKRHFKNKHSIAASDEKDYICLDDKENCGLDGLHGVEENLNSACLMPETTNDYVAEISNNTDIPEVFNQGLTEIKVEADLCADIKPEESVEEDKTASTNEDSNSIKTELVKVEKDVNKTDNFKCAICERSFTNQNILFSHMRSHDKTKLCKTCGKTVKADIDWKAHLKTHGKSVKRVRHMKPKKPTAMFNCGICARTLGSASGFYKHMRNHKDADKAKADSTETIYCKLCCSFLKCKFEFALHMWRHKNRNKSKKKLTEKVYCHICAKSFETMGGFNKHMLKHRGISYPCHICKKEFSQRYSLKVHMVVHTGEKSHICETCGARFTQKCHLNRHRVTHTGERKYKCDLCCKTFQFQTALNDHKKTHYGSRLRPHACNICSARFTSTSSLKVHKRTHSLKRDLKCNICEREFTQNGSLKKHKELHKQRQQTAKQAFITKPTLFCNKCPRGFVTKRGLVRHTKKHENGILKRHQRYVIREDASADDLNIKGETEHSNLLAYYEDSERGSALQSGAARNSDDKIDNYDQDDQLWKSSISLRRGSVNTAWKSIQFSNSGNSHKDSNAKLGANFNSSGVNDAMIHSELSITQENVHFTEGNTVDFSDDETVIEDTDMSCGNDVHDIGETLADVDRDRKNDIFSNGSSRYNTEKTTSDSGNVDNSECEIQCMRCNTTFYSLFLLMNHVKQQKCVRRGSVNM